MAKRGNKELPQIYEEKFDDEIIRVRDEESSTNPLSTRDRLLCLHMVCSFGCFAISLDTQPPF
jgi:hypothetical protein